MSELDQSSTGGLGLAFLLSEIRDFRKGLEMRDERINGSLDGLRGDVNTLSSALTKSQDHVQNIQHTVEELGKDVHSVRIDVDTILAQRSEDRVRADSEWAGPKKFLRNLALIGSGLGGLAATWYFFGPAIAAFIAASV